MTRDEPDPIALLLRRNRSWAEQRTADDPGFFARHADQQHPRYFWIGCADSRVPATEILDLDPGEMFVHRNVGNLARADDANFSAALSYAVDVLAIDHVLLVGHYGCGGVEAALSSPDRSVAQWLSPICETRARHGEALERLPRGARLDRLSELNVIDQAHALSSHPVMSSAWDKGRALRVYGLIYGVGDGLIGHVCTISRLAEGAPRMMIAESYRSVRAFRSAG